MEDNQNIYLDKVIEFLLRDTKIDYKNEKIFSHFLTSIPYFPFFPNLILPFSFPLSFSSYCKVTYGLTDQEIEYVWKEYKSIIKDKITNEQ